MSLKIAPYHLYFIDFGGVFRRQSSMSHVRGGQETSDYALEDRTNVIEQNDRLGLPPRPSALEETLEFTRGR